MGKSYVRFKAVDDLPHKLIGDTIICYAVADCIVIYQAARESSKGSRKKKGGRG